MKTSIVKELFLGILILIPVLYLGMQWDNLPQIVPTHWGFDGKPNGFSSKNSLIWIVLGLPLGIYLLLRFVYLFDPQKENYAIFGETFYRLRIILGIFMCFTMLATLYAGQHSETHLLTKGVLVGISLLFAAIGNYMPTMKPNWFVGIRTPWTLSNEEVWKNTSISWEIMVLGGIGSAILMLLLPELYAFYGFFTIVLLIALFPIVYSYVSYRKEIKN